MTERDQCCAIPDCCDMRGLLSFSILWLLTKKDMYGQEMAEELGKMRGTKPNPGTLYPALQELERRGLVETRKEGRKKFYVLTDSGSTGVVEACEYFCTVYADIFREYGVDG